MRSSTRRVISPEVRSFGNMILSAFILAVENDAYMNAFRHGALVEFVSPVRLGHAEKGTAARALCALRENGIQFDALGSEQQGGMGRYAFVVEPEEQQRFLETMRLIFSSVANQRGVPIRMSVITRLNDGDILETTEELGPQTGRSLDVA